MSEILTSDLTKSDKPIFKHHSVKAYTLKQNEGNKNWCKLGAGSITIYYNIKTNKAKLIFIDEKTQQIRVLQYIDDSCDMNEANNDPSSECIEWIRTDYTIDPFNPLKSQWKLQFIDSKQTAIEFSVLFKYHIVLSNKSMKQEFLEEITCYICYEYIKNARLLFCGHIGCNKCITDWIEASKNNDNGALCPKCRQQIKDKPISCLTINHIITEMKQQKGIQENICLCDQPYNPNDAAKYIHCDYCPNIYHPQCIGLGIREINKIDRYKCPLCQSKEEQDIKKKENDNINDGLIDESEKKALELMSKEEEWNENEFVDQTEDIDFMDDDDDDDDIDNDKWGEMEIVDQTEEIESLDQALMRKQDNECWKCPNCEILINIKLSIEKYDMKCFKCKQSQYIPDTTEIIYSKYWKTPKDFVWICRICTFQNHNITLNSCEVCDAQNPFSKRKNNNDNNNNNNNNNNNKMVKSSWFCRKCSFQNFIIPGNKSIHCRMCRADGNGNRPSWFCKDCLFENFNMNTKKCEVCHPPAPHGHIQRNLLRPILGNQNNGGSQRTPSPTPSSTASTQPLPVSAPLVIRRDDKGYKYWDCDQCHYSNYNTEANKCDKCHSNRKDFEQHWNCFECGGWNYNMNADKCLRCKAEKFRFKGISDYVLDNVKPGKEHKFIDGIWGDDQHWICYICDCKNVVMTADQCIRCNADRDKYKNDDDIDVDYQDDNDKVVERTSYWFCKKCKAQNNNNNNDNNKDKDKCGVCGADKRGLRKPIQFKFDINNNLLSFSDNDNDDPMEWSFDAGPVEIQKKEKCVEWKCTYCDMINENVNRCKLCGCKKCTKMMNINLSELIVFGFYRIEYMDQYNIEVPAFIRRLSQIYYVETDGFEYKLEYNGNTIEVHQKKYDAPQLRYCSFIGGADGYKTDLFGHQLVISDMKQILLAISGGVRNEIVSSVRYRWRIKVSLNKEFMEDFGMDGKDIISKNIAIGVISVGIDDTNCNKIDENGLYLKGNGFFGTQHRKRFCREFKSEDVITLELDLRGDTHGTMSYGINDDWYGIAFNGIFTDCYRLAVAIKSAAIIVQIIEFISW